MISVIVPVYKVEQYLRRCVDSILNQTYSDFELLLVDDGSPDACPQICDEYARQDPRVRVIHKPNGGLSDARNAGLAQADTKYVYFLDSDDYIEPQAIEILHHIAEQNNLDMLHFDNDVIQENDRGFFESVEYQLNPGAYPDVMPGREMYHEFVVNWYYRPPVQFYFYNRKFIQSLS